MKEWTPINVVIAVVAGILLLRVGWFILSLALGILWNLLILALTLALLFAAWTWLQKLNK